ncbi:MAG: hypothetical protein LBU38_06000 [Propionibacteriaceae bacterium]|jgi:hypothetical protein|nr:hypothetical protein [Propionibacteriaceae bacterium]
MNENKRLKFRGIAVLAVAAVVALGGLAGCSTSNPQVAEKVKGIPAGMPVVSGEVTPIAAEPEKSEWAFTVAVKDKAAAEAAVQAFVSAGYTEDGRSEFEERTNVALHKDTVNVSLALEPDGNGAFRVIYHILDTAGSAVAPPSDAPASSDQSPAKDDEKKDDEKKDDKEKSETQPSPSKSK